ncbi:methylenetetrahydrofolate reductase [NAD(P)H] [Mangrovivirga cuniculi]|uniref:Methylenetetrahydrofolate reductase n=1 Tax=Mangrovivirga cuniculi TaxID=2715131 RepID=A0A4D7JMY7_9BACT|nr:methylenetetrahydrofolate reductase [NAD(P)H] [Mangrovivirga cuniculi]QCK14870.1 methylenetetrahydrofolate reductase [NAD(P)H] [Mangrovivirga cuniculi]
MKVTEHFEKADKTLFTFEILPPLKGENIQKLYDHLDPLMEFKPPFIDVTYHREEFTYKKRENGLLERQIIRKRPGTVGICAAIKNKYNVDTVPHLICGGFSKEETENALIDLHFLGINNVLVLRGDAMSSEPKFRAEENGHNFASELLEQVKNMNDGIYLDEDLTNAEHTDFCIGVAGYPEKHFEAPNMATDLKYLKLKVDMGAQYIVTQMFFDNKKFIKFVEDCRKMDINVPIIPGLKPITTLNHLSSLPRHFYIDLPDDLVNEVEKCKNNTDVREVGVEWAIHQSKELLDFGVPSLHFYSMGKAEPVRRIASALF